MSLALATAHGSAAPLRPPLAGQTFQNRPDAVPSEQAVDRLLSCMAGFYADERTARKCAAELRQAHGLASTQLVLLSPRDAAGRQFARMAKLWASDWPARRPADGQVSMAFLGVVILLLLLAGWTTLIWSNNESLFNLVPMLAWLGGLLGLGVVVAWLLLWPSPRPHVRRFESRVQQQLAQGRWAVVLCKLPWAHQAGALAMLRANSVRWCAVAEPSARL